MSNADDRCAREGCGTLRRFHAIDFPGSHYFVEPAPQPAQLFDTSAAPKLHAGFALCTDDACPSASIMGIRHAHGPGGRVQVLRDPPAQPAPTLSTFNQVMAALRNPAVNLGDLDVCKACLSVESPYLHSVGTPCPTGPTVDIPQPAPSGDEAKVREIANAADIGVIVTRLGGSNRQLDEVYDLLDKLQKQAYAAGKADGAREERGAFIEGLTCDDSETGCSHAICGDVLAIARERGSSNRHAALREALRVLRDIRDGLADENSEYGRGVRDCIDAIARRGSEGT